MEYADWINGLKRGDDVIVKAGFINDTLRLLTVTHATPKQVEVEQERYWRKNGRRIGDSGFHRAYLLQPTPALMERVRREHVLSRLRNERWDNHPNEVLFAVAQVLESATSDPARAQSSDGSQADGFASEPSSLVAATRDA